MTDTPRDFGELDRILTVHASTEGALLPILHDVQAAFGYVSEEAERTIALALNLSRAEVHGVVSFYHDFHVEPHTRPVIRLCRAESCKARGVEALAAEFAGETRVAIEPIYCLGLCSVGPNALIGDTLHARLTPARFSALVETAAAHRSMAGEHAA
ncbi:NAD(P)H-dependent oxidoreductase subunit E [Novosphingobium sp.]|uniref:NAD(P)H-dependent oxidoreductase subunit E n=1 Tax=Novosphingobium sp. TaxID=1874826 RepID=UPI003B520A40